VCLAAALEQAGAQQAVATYSEDQSDRPGQFMAGTRLVRAVLRGALGYLAATWPVFAAHTYDGKAWHLRRLLAQLRLRPSDVLLIDDDPSNVATWQREGARAHLVVPTPGLERSQGFDIARFVGYVSEQLATHRKPLEALSDLSEEVGTRKCARGEFVGADTKGYVRCRARGWIDRLKTNDVSTFDLQQREQLSRVAAWVEAAFPPAHQMDPERVRFLYWWLGADCWRKWGPGCHETLLALEDAWGHRSFWPFLDTATAGLKALEKGYVIRLSTSVPQAVAVTSAGTKGIKHSLYVYQRGRGWEKQANESVVYPSFSELAEAVSQRQGITSLYSNWPASAPPPPYSPPAGPALDSDAPFP